MTRVLACIGMLVLGGCGGHDEAPGAPAASAGAGGLTARVVEGQCQGLGVGTTAQAGATLQTAPSERARLELSDGSTVVLDHESRLVLETEPRLVRLDAGQAVFDVAHLASGPPFRVKLATREGEVRVTGTKLAVRQEQSRTVVDVSRGEVRLACPRGEEVVRAGEQGVMVPGQAPAVAAAPDLGHAMSWSEAGAIDEEAGIGSLRARRPGVTSGAESELRLAEHRVQVRISGPLARTEIEQTFANDTAQELEGTYRFPLPAGARIVAMALEVDGTWREGRFVDRSTGERVWRGVLKNARVGGTLGRVDNDDILFAPGPWRDPALLAWEAGNRFSIRIFPIRPRSVRKVRLAYVETLPATADGRRYVYPLPQGQWASIGRSVADKLQVDVRITGTDPARPLRVTGLALQDATEGGARVLSASMDRFVPAGNLVIEAPEKARGPIMTATYRDGAELFGVLALRPVLPRARTARALEHVLLLDSSYGTTGEMWRRQVGVAQALVQEMSPEDRVTVLTCDVGCNAIGAPSQVPTAALARALGEALFRIEPGGTSNIVRAVEEGARMASSAAGRAVRIVYIGDGVATVGVRDPGRMAELAARAAATAHATISTVAVGTTCDERALAALATRTGGVALGYAPGDDATKTALRLLGRLHGAALEGARLELPQGATEPAPATFPVLHAGEEVWVGLRLAGPVRGDVVLKGTVEGQPFELRGAVDLPDASDPGNAWVPSAWAERRVLDLASAGDANREQVVALATRFGLVTPFTSLLVLDSDALAERLGLGPSAPTVQWAGEEAELEEASSVRGTRAPDGHAAGPRVGATDNGGFATSPGTEVTGGVSLGGRSEGSRGVIGGAGGGSGAGMGFGSLGRIGARAAPQVRVGGATVSGALDRDVIRRVVQRHINEARFCFERQLNANPELQGQVLLEFVISPSGAVSGSRIASSTFGGNPVEPCLAQMARRWMFPAPEGGGAVTVRFPFRFEPGEPQPVGRPGGWAPPSGGWGGLAPTITRVASVQQTRAPSQGLAVASQAVLAQVAELRAKLSAEPDRRRHHRDLARLLARIGELAEGTAATRAWLARDAMDPEALTLLSDMLARDGERDRSIRTLASTVEIAPGQKEGHERMARLYERAGRLNDACAHRVTLAALSPSDDAAAAAATRCETTNDGPGADDVRGDLVLAATFESSVDLDVAVVYRDGTRVSWMGGKKNVRAAAATSLSNEKLGIGFLPVGSYVVEIVRSGDGPAAAGSLDVRVLGEHRTIPFRLEGRRAAVATITVSSAGLGIGRTGGFGL